MRIPVESLRRIATLLFDRLESLGHSEVDVRRDLYWEVDRDRRYDLGTDPENLVVGQLTEDWSRLEEMLRDDRRRAMHGLVRFGAILREIGESLAERRGDRP